MNDKQMGRGREACTLEKGETKQCPEDKRQDEEISEK